MSNQLRWASLVLGILVATGAQAHNAHQHDPHQHNAYTHRSLTHGETHGHHHNPAEETITSAHVHGEVTLQLALEGKDLVMTLQSPAINLLGFEQRASTPAQIHRLKAVEVQLRELTTWLTLDGGECQTTLVTTDFRDVQPQAEPAENQQGHADIALEAQWTCAHPAKLRGLQMALFDDFPGVEKVTVQWLLDTEAGERVLNRNRVGLRF